MPRLARVPLIGLGDMIRLKIVFNEILISNKTFFSLTRYREFQLIDQNILSSSLIAGFVDHQCLWKESKNGFDFLHSDSHIRTQARCPQPHQSLRKFTLCVFGWFGGYDQIENSSE